MEQIHKKKEIYNVDISEKMKEGERFDKTKDWRDWGNYKKYKDDKNRRGKNPQRIVEEESIDIIKELKKLNRRGGMETIRRGKKDIYKEK